MVIRDRTRRQQRTPVSAAIRRARIAGGEIAGGREAVVAQAVRALQRGGAIDLVQVQVRAPGVARRTGAAALGGDQDHAVGCALAVNRGGSGTLQDLDVLDVVRVDVDEAVGGDCATTVAAT